MEHRRRAYWTPRGNISNTVLQQNTNSTVRTSGFEADYDDAIQRATGTAPTPPGMNQGDIVCVTEAFFAYPDINFLAGEAGEPTRDTATVVHEGDSYEKSTKKPRERVASLPHRGDA